MPSDARIRFERICGVAKFSREKENSCKNSYIFEPGFLKSFFDIYFKLSDFAGINIKSAKSNLNLVLSIFLFLTLLSALFQAYTLLLLGLLIILVHYLKLKQKISNRAKLFEKDYTAFLVSLASAVRSGIDPFQALCETSDIFSKDSVLRAEVLKTKACLEKGDSEQRVISNFGKSIFYPDLKLFRTAFLLSREQGSSISSCLQRLSKVTRHRQSFRRRVKSAVAMQKLSAYGIAGSACVIGIMQYFTNPKAVLFAYNHELGFSVLLFGVSLIVIGIIWMLIVSKSKL